LDNEAHPPAMRVGDMDGQGVVYDRMGKPVLGQGESISAQRTADAFALFVCKRAKGQPLLHHGQGEVGLTMTGSRLIVLIDPSLGTARRVLQLPGDESWSKGMELFKVIQGRGRYYLVLEWSEVPRVKVPSPKRDTVPIPVRPSEGGVYTLLVDRETAAWVDRSWRAAR
jgi:hypothetical protein